MARENAHKTEGTESAHDQRRIQSIEVGFRLISVLEAATAKLPLKIVAERAGMPASKAHLYMVSFIRLGLVVQDPTTMRYGLGPYAVHLGLAGMRQLDVLSVARDPMEELQQRCGLSIYLSVWGNMGPTIVAKFDGEIEIPMSIKVGHVLPLLTSATGRVFLAMLPASANRTVLDRVSELTLDVDRIVKDAKREIADTGIALSDSRVFEGFAALSAPVLDHTGAIAAAITVIGLRSKVEIDARGRLADDLRATCQKIGEAIGWNAAPPDEPPIQRAPTPKGRVRRVSCDRATGV